MAVAKLKTMAICFICLHITCAFLLLSCGNEKSNVSKSCSKVKEGKFVYIKKNKFGNMYFLIDRNDTIQTESNQINLNFNKLKITWTDSCNYQLSYLIVNGTAKDSLISHTAKYPLRFTVEFVSDSFYTFSYKTFKKDSLAYDTLWYSDKVPEQLKNSIK